MSQIDTLPPLREVIATHQLSAKKSLGQNFLLDLNLTAKIARMAGDLPNLHVVEIGPGPGGLTRGLLAEGAAHVTAIEKDSRCIPALEEIAKAYPGRLTIIEGDALSTPLPAPAPGLKLRIAANLPYNVGTELLTRWLTPASWPPDWSTLTLMFQKEVADRIVAQPGGKAYGRLAILSQWRSDAEIVLNLPPSAFTPPPKVSSAVVKLTALPAPRYEADPKALSALVATAFQQRRKMLRASLKSYGSGLENALNEAGIAPTERAENVSIEGFARLSRVLQAG